MSDAYALLMERVKDIGRLNSIAQLLDWDQEVCMPKNGVAARAQQAALIAGLAHEQLVSDSTRELLDRAPVGEADPIAATNVRETRRSFDRASKVPTELVKEIARVSSLAKDSWVQARRQSEFAIFAPRLEQMVGLKKQQAECIGFTTEAYDALLDEYEPGATAAQIDVLFDELGAATASLLKRIGQAPRQPDASILTRHYPQQRQAELSRALAESMGFDFDSGRDDVSVHPFCTTIGGCGDVRITTRYQEDFFPCAIFGTMHESGHGLYEQGMRAEHCFTPMAEAISLGIHESQSRLWENMVGRSRAFWECHYKRTQDVFSAALADVSLDAFYGAINAVAPSMIRVEADEVTYNLHIVARFRIERDLLAGKIGVSDIPTVWNDTMAPLLGINPANDAEGCLQDIHWSMGALGYFPTYALGNLYAAQFFEQARKDLPDLFEHIRNGKHQPLRAWLRENIHVHGRRYGADELVRRVTGKPLSVKPFMDYITGKVSEVYGL